MVYLKEKYSQSFHANNSIAGKLALLDGLENAIEIFDAYSQYDYPANHQKPVSRLLILSCIFLKEMISR